MTLKQRICDAGVKTLAEYICLNSGSTIFVDGYTATVQDDQYIAKIDDQYEATIIDDTYTATTSDENIAIIIEENYNGDTKCQ